MSAKLQEEEAPAEVSPLVVYESKPCNVQAVELTDRNFMRDYAAPKVTLLSVLGKTVAVQSHKPAEVGDFCILEDAETDSWYLCPKAVFEMKYKKAK